MAYPEAKTIHLVMDNLHIHRRKPLAEVFGPEMAAEVWDRFTVHYTPTHGSWLNQAEIEIGLFSRQCLGSRRIPTLKMLRQEAKAWNGRMNRARVKIAAQQPSFVRRGLRAAFHRQGGRVPSGSALSIEVCGKRARLRTSIRHSFATMRHSQAVNEAS
jgi:hypothetical protein